jgi:hypothetical protein
MNVFHSEMDLMIVLAKQSWNKEEKFLNFVNMLDILPKKPQVLVLNHLTNIVGLNLLMKMHQL